MVDSTFRHPKFAALVVIGVMALGVLALAGPRDDSVIGVGDAAAADADDSTTTTDATADDGVVFTIPDGELGTVIAGPSTSSGEDVEAAGPTPGVTVVAPSTTVPPASPSPPPTSAPAQTGTDVGADDRTTVDGTSEPAPADDPNSEGPTPDDTGVTPDGSVDDAAAADDGTGVVEAQVTTGGPAVIPAAFADVGELTGSASGYPLPAPTVIGQIDSRDSASTPWLLLIGANFVVAGGALVALRLRR